MIKLKFHNQTKDLRTGTYVLYAQASITDYLKLVGKDFHEFEIQRTRQKYKTYERMKEDIRAGALLPAITLAIRVEFVHEYLPFIEEENFEAIQEKLATSDQVRILDGLQRTYILNDLASEGHNFPSNQTVHLEFWFEPDLSNLVYRIIVLNAGQKPMSLRHQIELLFSTIRTKLEAEIEDLEILTEREGGKRTRARRYPLERIVTAFQSFMIGSPHLDKQNLVANQLNEQGIFDLDDRDMAEKFRQFQLYLALYADLDREIGRIYVKKKKQPQDSDEAENKIFNFDGLDWFGDINTMNAFFAAFADYSQGEEKTQQMETALERMKHHLIKSNPGDDPLGIETYLEVYDGFPLRKINIGTETRNLIFRALYDFFRYEGERNLSKIWSRV